MVSLVTALAFFRALYVDDGCVAGPVTLGPHVEIDLNSARDAADIVGRCFGGLYSGDLAVSSIRVGQSAANALLAALDVTGYASRRSEVLPKEARGASVLSPYIRHNILTLDEVARAVRSAPYKDREKMLLGESVDFSIDNVVTVKGRPESISRPLLKSP